MTPIPSRKLRNTLIYTLLIGLALAAMPPASAQSEGNQGSIKVHDEAVVVPPTRNDPHVSCDFYIEGFNMEDDSGYLLFFRIPPTSNPPEQVLNATWTGAPEADQSGGFHFLAGPFNFTEGHYRVEAYNDDGAPGDGQGQKSKVFWVNPCEPGAEQPPCPPNVTATAQEDGSILVDWDAVENATAYRIYRASGEEDLQFHATTTDTEFLDTNTTVGTTYRYMVTAVVDGQESDDCPVVEATAIPFFPGMIAGALAVLGAVGAFAYARRR